MAVTVTKDMPAVERISRSLGVLTGTIAFDSSYPTDGESVLDITKYFKNCKQIVCQNYKGYMFEFDATNKKLKVHAPVNVVAGAGTAGVNNYLFKGTGPVVEVDGTGTAFQLAGAEVLNATDLSGLTAVPFVAIGLI